jgi:hypothetical protein
MGVISRHFAGLTPAVLYNKASRSVGRSVIKPLNHEQQRGFPLTTTIIRMQASTSLQLTPPTISDSVQPVGELAQESAALS